MELSRLSTCILADLNPLAPVTPEPLFTFSIGTLHIVVSNHMFMVGVATVLLLLLIPWATRSRGLVPGGALNFIESVCLYLREEMVKPILGHETDRFINFIWTLFFFILSLNLLALIPSEKIIMLITGKENHFGGAATANIWITGSLAMVTFFVTHLVGIKKQGLWHYLVNLAPPAPWWILPLIYLLEIITMFVRPFTLAVRLFANMVAGHIGLATFIGLILLFKSYAAAVPVLGFNLFLSGLELLIAVVQAFIFACLSTLYISFSIASEH